jgi:carbamoyltransferase
MKYWGVNALNHGSSLAVFSDHTLVSFETSKNDELEKEIIDRALGWGKPEIIYWYENPWTKKLRQFRAGQYSRMLSIADLPRFYLLENNIDYKKLVYTPHHGSHAAAGYYTSPFDDAAVVVLDAIGEFECASIWHGQGNNLKRVWNRTYPNSLGLFYSAFAHLVGFKPILEEHLFQSSSEHGDPNRYYEQVKAYFNGIVSLRENLHKGVTTWPYPINYEQQKYDIAAAVQRVFEEQVDMVMLTAKKLTDSNNLVYMGGCAMNSRYNKRLPERWQGIWSLPSPGDYSSAIGAALYHRKHKVTWGRGIAKHLEIKYNKS